MRSKPVSCGGKSGTGQKVRLKQIESYRKAFLILTRDMVMFLTKTLMKSLLKASIFNEDNELVPKNNDR